MEHACGDTGTRARCRAEARQYDARSKNSSELRECLRISGERRASPRGANAAGTGHGHGIDSRVGVKKKGVGRERLSVLTRTPASNATNVDAIAAQVRNAIVWGAS